MLARRECARVSGVFARAQLVMACHETQNAHCVGWLANQIGRGNNIVMRLQMMQCENAGSIRLVGSQHDFFEETLPQA